MNKDIYKKAESEHKSGSLNSFLYKKISKKQISDVLFFENLLYKYKGFSRIGISDNASFRRASVISNHMKQIAGEYDIDIVGSVLSKNYKLGSSNDIYYAILKESRNKQSFVKTSYPNMSSQFPIIDEPFNLDIFIHSSLFAL